MVLIIILYALFLVSIGLIMHLLFVLQIEFKIIAINYCKQLHLKWLPKIQLVTFMGCVELVLAAAM